MLLSEFFEQLTYGELSNLSIGGKTIGNIEPEDYPAVIAHTNMALTALHKVFPLVCKEVIIQMDPTINVYHLHKDYAVNAGADSDKPIKYILDTAADPFQNTLLQIDRVVDENGKKLFLRENTEPTSLFTPSFNKLQVPNPTNSVLGVTYRATHPKLPTKNITPEEVELEIPESLLEPLLYYVASRAFMGTPPMDGVDRSSQYFGRYQASINRIKDNGLVMDDTTENQRIGDNGWV